MARNKKTSKEASAPPPKSEPVGRVARVSATDDAGATFGPNTVFLLRNAAGVGLLGLVLIYVVGSLSLTGQFVHIGIDPRLGLGFYSIDEILVRGIATVGSPAAILLVAAYGLNIILAYRPDLRGSDPPGLNLSRFRKGSAVQVPRWTGILLLAFGFAYLFKNPWPGCLAFIPWLLSGWYLQRFNEAESRWYLFESKAWVYIPLGTILLSTLLGTFLNPRPLDVAHLELKTGSSQSGALVAQTPDAWVLDAGGEKGEVAVLPAQLIESATIQPGDKDDGDGIADFVFDRLVSIF